MTTTQQPQAGPARPGLGTVRGRVALVTGRHARHRRAGHRRDLRAPMTVLGPHAEALARRCGARSLMVASYQLAEPPGAAGSMASGTAGAAYDTGGGR